MTHLNDRARSGADAPAAAARPLFAQIKARLRQDILEKRLPAGQKLPSEAQMQQAFGVSRITVRQALNELQAEGLIETLNGKGSFVTRPADAPRLGMRGASSAPPRRPSGARRSSARSRHSSP